MRTTTTSDTMVVTIVAVYKTCLSMQFLSKTLFTIPGPVFPVSSDASQTTSATASITVHMKMTAGDVEFVGAVEVPSGDAVASARTTGRRALKIMPLQ